MGFASQLQAQNLNKTSDSKVFVSSGMGFGFPIGEIKHTLRPKFSSAVGLNIPTKGKMFYYPAIEFLRFGYNENQNSDAYTYRIQSGTANIYNLSFMPGYAETVGPFKTYIFGGPSLQWVHEPRVQVVASQSLVELEKIKYFTGGVRAGVGAHFQSGNFNLFLEATWMHNFQDMQAHQVHVISLYGGLKTDITSVVGKMGDWLGGGAAIK